jgi:hypothetical protein
LNKYRAPNDEMKPGRNGSIFPAIVIAEAVFDIVCDVAVKCKIKQRQCLSKSLAACTQLESIIIIIMVVYVVSLYIHYYFL